ncbi:rhomboid family intramembrane serine protease [Gemmobacter tilapiae]|uniref:Rhomboid family intramembrane serine protease n=1 Tax=Neogemmobacter tilapiae TaxID=875041 RepID=A0A918WIG4_9RHOB|nr:rhomboid family intramembrane serine protease [Gemmobacter tilapiae]
MTWGLILANVAIFLAYYPGAASDRALGMIFAEYGMIPARSLAGQDWETLVTSMFLHGNWLHLGGNMLFLWIYGDNLEDTLGHLRFLLFYLVSGLAAAALHILPDPMSLAPMVGASGAIAGVMGGYLLLFPRAKIDVFLFFIIFFRIIPVPAWIVLGIWLILQLYSSFAISAEASGVAYFAHLGGFAAGVVLLLPLWLRRGGRRFWARTEGHPPHPEAHYPFEKSRIPRVGR